MSGLGAMLGAEFGGHELIVWLGFTGLVVLLLVLDLGVLNRRAHVLKFKEAIAWSASVVMLALLFGGFVFWREGGHAALEYYTGYLIELSLSVDNLFVFIMILAYFGVPAEAQPKVLKWGILGAIVMRFLMIAIGAVLLERFSWIIYVFGAVLIVTGVRMLRGGEEKVDLERNPVVRAARRVLPFAPDYDGSRFIIRTVTGRLFATPLLLVLLVIEWSDLVFAIDSIPAIFAVTRDPFLVYSSNVFAIVGLRALFFVLAGMMDKFAYLKPGVAVILMFVGAKMVTSHWVPIPIVLSLGVIVVTLAGAVLLSIRKSSRDARQAAHAA